jgi:hypothetical protein
MVKLDRPIEGEFDRESAYQSARSKGENAAEQSFGYRDIKTHRYPESWPRRWLPAQAAKREESLSLINILSRRRCMRLSTDAKSDSANRRAAARQLTYKTRHLYCAA